MPAHCRCLVLLALAILSAVSGEPPAPAPRIGDPGSVPDATRFDPRFPEMAGWATAGVTGGVPTIDRELGRVAAEGDLAAAIAGADVSADRPGVLRLAAGTFRCDGVVRLKPGLVLRGEGRDRTVIASTLNEEVSPYGVGEKHALVMARRSGLEDLTVCNAVVQAIPEATYLGKYDNFGPPTSGLVMFGKGADDAWIDRCALTHAGSNPLSLCDCNHVTIRDTLIEKAYNKGGKGHGYLELGRAGHVLFYDCDIRDIRHVSIMWQTHHLVIVHCRLGVDLNYHDGLPYACLVEQTEVKRRAGHHWSPVCFGWPPWQKVGPGPRCLFWNNRFDGEGGGDGTVWILRDTTPGYAAMAETKPMLLDAGGPPTGRTLYAVTGRHIPGDTLRRDLAVAGLEAALAARDRLKAGTQATLVQRLFPTGAPERVRAEAVLRENETLAQEALARLGPSPKPAALRAFLTAWPEGAAADQARAQAATQAQAAWTALGAKPAADRLKGFLDQFDGLAPVAEARSAFDRLADDDLARVRSQLTTWPAIRQFSQRWSSTPAATRVEADFLASLRRQLDDLVARKAKLTASQRNLALATFRGTPLEAEARQQVLGK